jgi:hypothetical protein
MTDRTRITVRASHAQVAAIDAQARRLGISRSAYLLAAAVNRAEADSEMAEVRQTLEDFKTELAEAMDAALDAHGDRIIGNLRNVSDWMQRRWPLQAQK